MAGRSASSLRGMEFDHIAASLLTLRPDRPELSEADLDVLQDAHMSYLADLHDAGQLLAAGPFLGGPDRHLRGLSLLGVDVDLAVELGTRDPLVRAGRLERSVVPWMVPRGAMTFGPAHFPRSMSELG